MGGTILMPIHGFRDYSFFNQADGQTVTTNLLMHLDAGNPASYPGSGTSWLGLSGTTVNATLVNSVGYSPDNKGYLTFNGSNQVATIPFSGSPFRQTSQITYSFWAYKTVTGASNIMGTSVSGGGGTGAIFFGSDTSISFYWTPSNPVSDRTISATISTSLNTWAHYAFTMVYSTGSFQWYQNGVALTSTINIPPVTVFTPTSSPYNQNINDSIGGWYVNSQFYFSGRISQVQVYNVALNATQISQNFNALRGRYGI